MTSDTGNERPSDHIKGTQAVSELHWSPDFVMQSIEILPVFLGNGGLLSLRPDHADSFIVGWPPKAQPEAVAAKMIERLGLRPMVLHSTSWRHHDDEVILTYLAVVSTDYVFPVDWDISPVIHVELARGDATSPPVSIDVSQVLEHGLRHLAWLLREDKVISDALPGWQDVLDGYTPEPFRALNGPMA